MIDRLPLNAWDWDTVQEVVGKNCWLDLIERQSKTKRNRSALFAWVWTWNPDMIPRASDFNVLQRPDVVRSRDSRPEGVPVEEGLEGPDFPVLIHLVVVKDYTPLSPSASPDNGVCEWPRTYTHKGWRMGRAIPELLLLLVCFVRTGEMMMTSMMEMEEASGSGGREEVFTGVFGRGCVIRQAAGRLRRTPRRLAGTAGGMKEPAKCLWCRWLLIRYSMSEVLTMVSLLLL